MKKILVGLLSLGSISAFAQYSVAVCDVIDYQDNTRTVSQSGLITKIKNSKYGDHFFLGALFNSKKRTGNCAQVIDTDNSYLFVVKTILYSSSDLELDSFCNFIGDDLVIREESGKIERNLGNYYVKKYLPGEHSLYRSGDLAQGTLSRIWFLTDKDMDWGDNTDLQSECKYFSRKI